MTALGVFTFSDTHQVRTVLINGEPWFVAADVATILGYSATAAMTRSLDDDEKGVQPLHTPGGQQQMVVVNEPGLYAAILRSTIPQARIFKRWVTHDVLPQIRQTGQFGSQLPATFAEALEMAAAQQRQIEAREAELVAARPKVEAFDALMDSDGFYSMGDAAKVIGVGRTTFFRQLREMGVLQTGNVPFQRYMHHFVVTASSYQRPDGSRVPTQTTRVRPSGLDYLRRKLQTEVPA